MVELEFICDLCGWPVDNGHGSLYVSFAELREHRHAMAEWKKASGPGLALSVAEILQLPGPVPWRIHHDSCRPAGNGDGYHIDVDHVRTWRALIKWTAHLMEKRWLPDTNWRVLLGNAADARDRRIVELTKGDAA